MWWDNVRLIFIWCLIWKWSIVYLLINGMVIDSIRRRIIGWDGLLVGGLIFDLWIDDAHSRIYELLDFQWTVMCSVEYLESII